MNRRLAVAISILVAAGMALSALVTSAIFIANRPIQTTQVTISVVRMAGFVDDFTSPDALVQCRLKNGSLETFYVRDSATGPNHTSIIVQLQHEALSYVVEVNKASNGGIQTILRVVSEQGKQRP